MVVGQDIAVGGEDQAGAGSCRSGLIAPEVGGDGGGDANGGIDVSGIDLSRRQFLAGVDVGNVDDSVFPDALQNRGGLFFAALGPGIQEAAAESCQTAYQGADQDQRHRPQALVLFLRFFLLRFDRCVDRTRRAIGGFGVGGAGVDRPCIVVGLLRPCRRVFRLLGSRRCILRLLHILRLLCILRLHRIFKILFHERNRPFG